MNTSEPELRTQESYAENRRPINTDPREQPGPAMNPGPYYPPQWPAGQPAGMLPPRQRHSPWYWMVIGFVIVIVILGGLASFAFLSTHTTTLAPRSFTVGNQPTLVLNESSGDVHIVSGPEHQITVRGTERTSAWSSTQIPIHYQQSGDTVTVSIDQINNIGIGLFYQDVQIDVTVPSQTNLAVTADSGNITNDGATGQMTLRTSSGTITTNGGSGQIILGTESGDIHASNISGQMTLTTSSGTITATNASASGASTFQTDSGDIHFSGSLAATGTDRFKASSGTITLALPNDAAFQVQASTESGDIHSGFAGVNVLHGNGSGATAAGRAGTGPAFAQVTIQTDSGDINLDRS